MILQKDLSSSSWTGCGRALTDLWENTYATKEKCVSFDHTSAFLCMHTCVFTHSCCGQCEEIGLINTARFCTCSETSTVFGCPVCCSAQPQYVLRLLKTHISSHEIEHTRYYLQKNLKEAWHCLHWPISAPLKLI